ncbi:hypothetical protein BGZ76_002278 [Entomortierella beljakovae]|nr:hypothetical protein BGZ76_002278 [Entomortierella beljakovae]
MSLQVNFNTHGHDLKAAYEAVLNPSDPKNGDNWTVFGYDKGSNDLKVLSQGNGGLEELEEEFVDGKIQYAFARVVDPYSQLNKFVLVAWCGDGVPESKKGLFNSHLNDVARFLKGFHLQINARCEADVTPALIMRKLDEGSGSKYSTHKEDYRAEKIQPLQSAYKRTEVPDISALQRNPTKPEPAPKYNIGGTKPLGFSSASSTSSAPAVPAKLQDRVWPPPASSSSSSAPSPPTSNPAAERSWKTSGGGSSYSASSTTSFNKVQPPASLTSYSQVSPEPVVNKAHQIRLEREAREKEERERIKREIAASEARDKSSESTSTAQKLADERRLQEIKEREREQERVQQREQPQEPVRNVGFNRVREERLAREKEERERAEAEDAARAAREAAKNREQEGFREQASAREEEQKRQLEQQQKREREAREEEARRAREQDERKHQQEQDEARRQQDREEEEENQRRQQAEEDSRKRQQEDETRKQREKEEADRLRKQEEEDQRRYDEEQEEERRRQEAEDRERQASAAAAAATAATAIAAAAAVVSTTSHAQANQHEHDGSVSAVVLYSYEKSEENEMTLFEGEVIRNVTELDVGWWSGESEDGTRSGLFPANYVEVIENTHEQAGAAGYGASAEQDYHQDGVPDRYAEEPSHDAAHPSDEGYTAEALYDYQAGEPNEISFSEGETITLIEFVAEDWWSGTNAVGAKGLFPGTKFISEKKEDDANYVQRTS